MKCVPVNLDSITIAKLLDKIEKHNKFDETVTSCFIDPAISQFLKNKVKLDNSFLYGGYDEAERVMLILPGSREKSEMEEYFTLVRINLITSKNKSACEITHRDYLGSVLGLGITRDMVGDIIVFDGGADVITKPEMGSFINDNLQMVGKYTLKTSILPISQFLYQAQNGTEKRDTVASLRLDCVVSAAYNLPRAEVQAIISSGNVNINWAKSTKADTFVKENDLISVRAKGRFKINLVGSVNKRNKIPIVMLKY